MLKWFLGDQEIAPLHPQTNSTEPDNPRTWSAASVVQIPATKVRHGMPLKCLAFHEYYSARTVGVEARMDVRCKFFTFFCFDEKYIFLMQGMGRLKNNLKLIENFF